MKKRSYNTRSKFALDFRGLYIIELCLLTELAVFSLNSSEQNHCLCIGEPAPHHHHVLRPCYVPIQLCARTLVGNEASAASFSVADLGIIGYPWIKRNFNESSEQHLLLTFS